MIVNDNDTERGVPALAHSSPWPVSDVYKIVTVFEASPRPAVIIIIIVIIIISITTIISIVIGCGIVHNRHGLRGVAEACGE